MYQLKKSYSLTDLAHVDEADSSVNATRAIGFTGPLGGDAMEQEFGKLEPPIIFSFGNYFFSCFLFICCEIAVFVAKILSHILHSVASVRRCTCSTCSTKVCRFEIALLHSSREFVPHAAQESLDGAVGVLRGAEQEYSLAEEAAAVARYVRVRIYQTKSTRPSNLLLKIQVPSVCCYVGKPIRATPSNSPPPPSSGYSSAAEFFPMDADSSMNTDDYELYNPRMMAQQSHLRRRQGCQMEFSSIALLVLSLNF